MTRLWSPQPAAQSGTVKLRKVPDQPCAGRSYALGIEQIGEFFRRRDHGVDDPCYPPGGFEISPIVGGTVAAGISGKLIRRLVTAEGDLALRFIHCRARASGRRRANANGRTFPL